MPPNRDRLYALRREGLERLEDSVFFMNEDAALNSAISFMVRNQCFASIYVYEFPLHESAPLKLSQVIICDCTADETRPVLQDHMEARGFTRDEVLQNPALLKECFNTFSV